MRKFTDEEREAFQNPLRCYDCGQLYGDPAWIEAVVPDAVWEAINPTYWRGAGILCIICMARRCYEAGLDNVSVKLYGVFTHEENPGRKRT